MLALADKLAQDTLRPAQSADLRTQLLGLLDRSQRRQIKAWKTQTMKQTGEFASTRRQIIGAVERAMGMSEGSVKNWLDSVLVVEEKKREIALRGLQKRSRKINKLEIGHCR